MAVTANPSGANVVHGAATFNGLGTAGLTINQTSNAAIINWQNFSIGAGEWTQFVQPGSGATAINRVVSGNPSEIYGSLSANGNVMVINPNGIVVGASGVIDVAGAMTLSTLDASNSDLLNGGSNRFYGSGSAGVTNYGAVSAGDVIVLGNFVSNSGSIVADRSIAIGAGGDILVNQTLDGATISVRGGAAGGAEGISNSGGITGGSVDMKAHGNSYALAINNTGTGNIRAKGYSYRGGILSLNAGNSGRVVNTGNLYARQQQTGRGGQINVTGGNVDLQSGRIDASGFVTESGGQISVQAQDLNIGANALLISDGADGGSMKLEGANSATLAGRLSSKSFIGNGGSIDLTSAETVEVESSARVDVSGMAGGSVRIGGGLRGEATDIANATQTTVRDGALIIADGWNGDGGDVVVWADGDTMYSGDISAQALGATGNGGFVEVSGKRNLHFDGFASTLANNGQVGTLLLDPMDVIVADTGGTISGDTLVGNNGGSLATPSTSGGLIHANNVIIHTTGSGGVGDITIGLVGGNADDLHYSSSNSLTFLAHSRINVNSNVLNHQAAGAGNINLVAGWDGNLPADPSATVDFAAASALGWGASGGDIFINREALQEVSVGSRSGETNLLGASILAIAGDGDREFAHIGYRNSYLVDRAGFHSSGDINVYAKGSVGLLTNSRSDGVDNFAMIGHGGSNHSSFNAAGRYEKAAGRGSMGGNITVNTTAGLIMRGGDDRSFTQIGHGGLGVNLNNGVTDGAGNGAANGSMEGIKTGDITVLANTILMKANDRSSEGANLGRDASTRAGARIGHGGFDYASGAATGNITVVSQTGIRAEGSHNTDGSSHSVIQIGHGGMRSSSAFGIGDNAPEATIGPDTQAFDPAAGGHTGNISVTALNGDVEFFAGDRDWSPAQIGHGGTRSHGSHVGDVTVAATGNVIMSRFYHDGIRNNGTQDIRRAGDRSQVQIGHGGFESVGRMDGDILVNSGGNFEMYGGNGQSHAMVGHGGNLQTGWVNNQGRNAHANLNGNITMNVGGDMIMKGGMDDNDAFTMVGHGGREWIADHQGGFTGNIDVNVTGSLEMASGNEDFDDWEGKTVYGSNNFALIGHGGIYAKGNHSGSVDVSTGGNLEMTSFGGWEGARDNGGTTRYDQQDTGGLNFVKIGHGGYRTAFMDGPPQNGDIHFHMWTGAEPSAPQGIDAPVTVSVGGDIAMTAIKDLGDQRTGIPTIASGAPADPERRGFEGFVVIGNGSDEREGNSSRRSDEFQFYRGDVNVSAGGKIDLLGARVDNLNDLAVQVGTQAYDGIRDSYAQIGHHAGYVNRTGYWEGNIVVDAGSDIRIESGSAGASYAMVGHGGIDVGTGGRGTADIGRTQMNGDIDVWSGGNITIEGGELSADPTINEQYAWHQFAGIGHYNARNRSMQSGVTSSSDITVVANGNLTMLGHDNTAPVGGTDMMSQAHIGHGSGDYLRLDIESDIDVTVGGDFTLTAGTHPEADIVNFAKVGHGNRYAHGGGGQYWRRNVGELDGDIAVKVGQNITSIGGLIGHVDTSENDDNGIIYSGDTFIASSMSSSDFNQGSNYGIFASTKTGGGFEFASVFSSGDEGLNGGLRLYMPNRPQNNIDTTTYFNASTYSGDPGGIADHLSYTGEVAQVNTNPDENLDFYTSMASQNSPLLNQARVQGVFNGSDPYGVVNGLGEFYQIYYNNLTPQTVVVPPTGGGGGTATPGTPTVVVPPPPVPFDYTAFVGETQWEAYDFPYGLLAFDGYDSYLGNFSPADMVVSEENYIPRSGLEEALDAAFGRRRWTWRPGVEDYILSGDGGIVGGSDYSLEQAEDLDRVEERAMRGAGKGKMTFYLYDPSTSRYSSLRLFGYPTADVLVFEAGQ